MVEPQTYRAARSAYVVFGIMCGVLAVLGTWAALVSPMSWGPVLIPAGAYVLACVWLSRYRLVFSVDGLSYGSLFTPERVIPYRSIESIKPIFFTGRFAPPQRVLVKTKTGEELLINTKVFSREAVKRLVALKTHEGLNPSLQKADAP